MADVDITARVVAGLAAIGAWGKILWDACAYWHQGRQHLSTNVWAEDEPRGLHVKVTNIGRRPVYVQRAVLCYTLQGQELYIDLLKKTAPEDDRKLEPFGDSEFFRWLVSSDKIMQLKLGFQQDPDYLYIVVRSRSGEIHRISNQEVQGMVRHLLNEFNPT
jgi:hypothetical protein